MFVRANSGGGGGKKIHIGTFTAGSSDVTVDFTQNGSGDIGFTPSFLYVYNYVVSSSGTLTDSKMSALYDTDMSSSYQIRSQLYNNTKLINTAAILSTVGNSIKSVGLNQFVFNGTTYQGTYKYVAIE